MKFHFPFHREHQKSLSPRRKSNHFSSGECAEKKGRTNIFFTSLEALFINYVMVFYENISRFYLECRVSYEQALLAAFRLAASLQTNGPWTPSFASLASLFFLLASTRGDDFCCCFKTLRTMTPHVGRTWFCECRAGAEGRTARNVHFMLIKGFTLTLRQWRIIKGSAWLELIPWKCFQSSTWQQQGLVRKLKCFVKKNCYLVRKANWNIIFLCCYLSSWIDRSTLSSLLVFLLVSPSRSLSLAFNRKFLQ